MYRGVSENRVITFNLILVSFYHKPWSVRLSLPVCDTPETEAGRHSFVESKRGQRLEESSFLCPSVETCKEVICLCDKEEIYVE